MTRPPRPVSPRPSSRESRQQPTSPPSLVDAPFDRLLRQSHVNIAICHATRTSRRRSSCATSRRARDRRKKRNNSVSSIRVDCSRSPSLQHLSGPCSHTPRARGRLPRFVQRGAQWRHLDTRPDRRHVTHRDRRLIRIGIPSEVVPSPYFRQSQHARTIIFRLDGCELPSRGVLAPRIVSAKSIPDCRWSMSGHYSIRLTHVRHHTGSHRLASLRHVCSVSWRPSLSAVAIHPAQVPPPCDAPPRQPNANAAPTPSRRHESPPLRS